MIVLRRLLQTAVLLAASTLTTSHALAETVSLSGSNAELIRTVAEELRAIGMDVTILADGEPIVGRHVRIERSADSVVITLAPSTESGSVDGRPTTTLSPDVREQEAMDLTALRIAEAIRLLVTPSTADRPEERADIAESPVATPPNHRPEVPAGSSAPRAEPGDAGELPIFSLGLLGGAGYVVPSPAMAFGLVARGHASPHVSIAARVMGTTSLGEGDQDEGTRHSTTVKTAIVASWDLLGAQRWWSPSLGAGMLVDYRWWSNSIHGVDADGRLVHIEEQQGSRGSLGLALMAGLRFSHRLRFRLDVMVDADLVNWRDRGDGHDEMAPLFLPSVLGIASVEYDIVSQVIDPSNH